MSQNSSKMATVRTDFQSSLVALKWQQYEQAFSQELLSSSSKVVTVWTNFHSRALVWQF